MSRSGKTCPWGVKAAVLVAVLAACPNGILWAQATLEYEAQQAATESAMEQAAAAPSPNMPVAQPTVPAPSDTAVQEDPLLPKPVMGWLTWVKSLFLNNDGKVIWQNIVPIMILVLVLVLMH